MNKRNLTAAAAAICLTGLLLGGKTAAAGAAEGAALCGRVLIPALFPFLFFCGLLMSALLGQNHGFLCWPGTLFRFPKGAEVLWIPCLLGGYPIGCAETANAFRSGRLSQQEAERLLTYCGNPGPAFLFGIAGAVFPNLRYSFALWAVVLCSAFLVSRFSLPGSGSVSESKAPSLSKTMTNAVRAMAQICGWVILARLLLALGNASLSGRLSVLVSGAIELSNGCLLLGRIADPAERFVLAAGLLTFGGLCVILQTASAIDGLHLRYYLLGKTVQTAFSVMLAVGLVKRNPFFLLLPFILTYVIGSRKSVFQPPSVVFDKSAALRYTVKK